MELHRLSENEQAFVECFSRFVNGQMGSAAKVGNALADDHRYLINEKGKVVFAFLERLANDYQKGRYDQRDEWVCRLAAEAIEHLVSMTSLLKYSIAALLQRCLQPSLVAG